MSEPFHPAPEVVAGQRWWRSPALVWAVLVWVTLVPLSLALAQSYLRPALPGQRGASWGGHLAAVLGVVGAALFAVGAPAMGKAQVRGVRALRGQVGLLQRGRRRALARRVRRVQAVEGGDRGAAGLIARSMVVISGETLFSAGLAVMVMGMGAHQVVAWQVAVLGVCGMAALVAAVVRWRDGRRAARWLAADQRGQLTPAVPAR